MSKSKAVQSTDRKTIQQFEQIINVGPATAGDFRLLGYSKPQELIGKDPAKLFKRLGQLTKVRQDPCVLDVLISVIDYMNGNPPLPWWEYTEMRKEKYGQLNQ